MFPRLANNSLLHRFGVSPCPGQAAPGGRLLLPPPSSAPSSGGGGAGGLLPVPRGGAERCRAGQSRAEPCRAEPCRAGRGRCGRWSRLPAAGRGCAEVRRRGRGFLPPASGEHLGAGRGRPPAGGGRAAPKGVGGSGQGCGSGAWSAAAAPRRSRKRWKRGWTITATSPAPTLLGKPQGKAGEAAGGGRAFLGGERALLASPSLSPEGKQKTVPPPPPSKRAKTESSRRRLRDRLPWGAVLIPGGLSSPLGGCPRPPAAPEQQAAGCSLPGPAGPREARRGAGRCRPAGRGSEAQLVTPTLGLSLKSAAEPLAL